MTTAMDTPKTVGARALPEGIEVTFAPAEEGGTAPAPQVYDLVLQAVGRTPNGKKIAAEKAGVAVTDRGFINVDIQMRTNVPHIFAIGDIEAQRDAIWCIAAPNNAASRPATSMVPRWTS